MDTQNDPDLQEQIKALTAELADVRKQRAADALAAQEKEKQTAELQRVSAIRTALSGYQFVKPSLVEAAFKFVKDDIKLEDGQPVGPLGVSLEDYLNDKFRQGGDLDNLLAPKGSGGSGGTGSGRTATGGIDIDSIKPGADNSAAQREIARLTRELLNKH